jgi:hypothetical protein
VIAEITTGDHSKRADRRDSFVIPIRATYIRDRGSE